MDDDGTQGPTKSEQKVKPKTKRTVARRATTEVSLSIEKALSSLSLQDKDKSLFHQFCSAFIKVT